MRIDERIEPTRRIEMQRHLAMVPELLTSERQHEIPIALIEVALARPGPTARLDVAGRPELLLDSVSVLVAQPVGRAPVLRDFRQRLVGGVG